MMLELNNLDRESGLKVIRAYVAQFTGWGNRLAASLQGEILRLEVVNATPEQASCQLTADQCILAINVCDFYEHVGRSRNAGLDLMNKIVIRNWFYSLKE